MIHYRDSYAFTTQSRFGLYVWAPSTIHTRKFFSYIVLSAIKKVFCYGNVVCNLLLYDGQRLISFKINVTVTRLFSMAYVMILSAAQAIWFWMRGWLLNNELGRRIRKEAFIVNLKLGLDSSHAVCEYEKDSSPKLNVRCTLLLMRLLDPCYFKEKTGNATNILNIL